ncbi:SOS response-associated peptidase family protein [Novosphingobium sp. RD2P27]|uniref:Abasic site processing protein n=1 Tax=Novosphingobium kalidii TaxID=3230299 RepID=A0ABV2D3R5_9SPHN
MCNHYRLQADYERLMRGIPGLHEAADGLTAGIEPEQIDVWPTRPNATELEAVKYPGTVVRWEGDRQVIDRMAWGIVTTIKGARDQPLKKAVTNVRNLASPLWKGTLASRSQRCLVPFSRFAEPKIGEGRAEHWFSVSARPTACFAGIWRVSEGLPRFAFLTCAPNPLVAPLHPKAMPVILHEDDYDRWMEGADAAELAQPFPSQLMTLET